MPGYTLLRQVALTSGHTPRPRPQRANDSDAPRPAALKIITYPEIEGCYLLQFDGEGSELTDTFHTSVAEALELARWEFQVQPEEWGVLG